MFDSGCPSDVWRVGPRQSKPWPRQRRIEQTGQPRACDSGLCMGDLDRLLLVAICQRIRPVAAADWRCIGESLGGSLALVEPYIGVNAGRSD